MESGAEWRGGAIAALWMEAGASRGSGPPWEVRVVEPDVQDAPAETWEVEAACALLGSALPAGTCARLTWRRVDLAGEDTPTASRQFVLVEVQHPPAYRLTTGWSGPPTALAGRLQPLAGSVASELDLLERAATVDPGRWPVALDGEAAGVLAVMGAGYLLEADRIAGGTSRLAGVPLGAPVAPRWLSLVDDPTAPGAVLAFTRDDTAEPTCPAPLLAAGRLAGYLTDTATARRLGVTANGHARCEDGLTPLPRAANLEVLPATGSDAAVLEAATGGLWGQGVSAAVVDVATGLVQISVRCGFRVRSGRLAEPVAPFTLHATFPEAWGELVAAGHTAVSALRPMGRGRPLQTVPIGFRSPALALEVADVA